jgi:acetolactate synthase-1/2/3 large subunit
VLEALIAAWKRAGAADPERLAPWWGRSTPGARATACAIARPKDIIKPQHAIERLYALTKDRDVYITTEVGQHQMWAAQFYRFQDPNRWMTSGGLGTMGYGLPAAVGVQVAHPGAWSSTSPATPRCR